MAPVRLDTLPAEMVESIASHLSCRSASALRLTSSYINSATIYLFGKKRFTTIRENPSLNTLKVLLDMSKNTKLGKYVRTLSFDGRKGTPIDDHAWPGIGHHIPQIGDMDGNFEAPSSIIKMLQHLLSNSFINCTSFQVRAAYAGKTDEEASTRWLEWLEPTDMVTVMFTLLATGIASSRSRSTRLALSWHIHKFQVLYSERGSELPGISFKNFPSICICQDSVGYGLASFAEELHSSKG